MSDIVKIENLEKVILEVRGVRVLIGSDVAQIYGVETRDINKAVTNNPDKFPSGYIVELTKTKKSKLVENFHRFEKFKHSTVNPKAITEKSLYMLATIFKSPVATQATISIIEILTDSGGLQEETTALGVPLLHLAAQYRAPHHSERGHKHLGWH